MKLTRELLLKSVCDGKKNLDCAGACRYLHVSENALYQLVKENRLHPVHVKGALVFARSDLERYRGEKQELELTKAFMDGRHPLDVFYEADGRYPLKEVNRVMYEWARLTGVWLIEAPRGSFARWLARMQLTQISPRSLRRLVEAMLTDVEIGKFCRVHLADRRTLNGMGETKAKERAKRRGAGYVPDADADALPTPDAPS